FRKHVPASRLPRVADFLPYLTPPAVAQAIVRGLHDRTPVLDVPGYNGALQTLFHFAPEPLRWVMSLGGQGTRDYGKVEWGSAFAGATHNTYHLSTHLCATPNRAQQALTTVPMRARRQLGRSHSIKNPTESLCGVAQAMSYLNCKNSLSLSKPP